MSAKSGQRLSSIRDADPSPGKGPPPDTTDEVSVLLQELDRRHAENAELRGLLNDRRRQYEAILSSTSWRITAPLRAVVQWLRGSFGRGFAGGDRGAPFRIDRATYDEWVRDYSAISPAARALLRARVDDFQVKPLISVVMPSYNIDPKYLREAIESVRRQIYPFWELCISDDASTIAGVRECVQEHASVDRRIRTAFRETNGNISANSNTALELATGDYVALLDADDLLAEDALFWVAQAISAHPDVDLIYSDEDKLDETGQRFDPYFKTAWNPALMRAQNAFSHLGVFRRSLVEQVGRFREGYEGAQDHDLVLRCADATTADRICHIPRVLYHWRVSANSTAQTLQAKPYAWNAGRRAIEDHLARRGTAGQVAPANGIYYQVSYTLPEPAPLVSIIMPSTLANPVNLACLQSVLGKTRYPHFELLIVAREEHLAAARAKPTLAAALSDPRVSVQAHDLKPFNYSLVNNLGVAAARGSLICFLNDDIEVISEDWLAQLVSRVSLEGVGGCGPMLYYPSSLVQHAGVLLGIGGVADHAFRNMERTQAGYFARGVLEQDYSSLTAACLLVRRAAFEAANGFDADLPAAFNDIDLCIRLRRDGWRMIWTPAAQLYHHESLTFGDHRASERRGQFSRDLALMRSRWQTLLARDPYYNPNLSLDPAHQFQLAFPPRVPYPPGFLPRAPTESGARTASLK
jgi:GT2 family glycosyltransferase